MPDHISCLTWSVSCALCCSSLLTNTKLHIFFVVPILFQHSDLKLMDSHKNDFQTLEMGRSEEHLNAPLTCLLTGWPGAYQILKRVVQKDLFAHFCTLLHTVYCLSSDWPTSTVSNSHVLALNLLKSLRLSPLNTHLFCAHTLSVHTHKQGHNLKVRKKSESAAA